MKALFRQIKQGVIAVAKSLAFISILLGLFSAWDGLVLASLAKIWTEQGWRAGINSGQWIWGVPFTFAIITMGGLFFYTERKQCNKAEEVNNQIISKLDGLSTSIGEVVVAVNKNTEVLEKLILAITQRTNQENKPTTEKET